MSKTLLHATVAITAAALLFSACEDAAGPGTPSDSGGDDEPGLAAPFMDRTDEAGFSVPGDRITPESEPTAIVGGVAVGDVDNDGDLDLLIVRSSLSSNLLYLNDGTGTFQESALHWWIDETPQLESGPLFADLNGDGYLDLVLGGVRREGHRTSVRSTRLFMNVGGERFEDVTNASGIELPDAVDTYSSSAGDVDGDGDLDLLLTHWRSTISGQEATHGRHFLWRNDGGTFTDITSEADLSDLKFTFAGNFTDVDMDGDLDILMASDFGNSKVLINDGQARFTNNTGSVLTDGNGMGAAVGDYDNDGDLDWFVSSIWDPNGEAEGNWDTTGNRLYQNDGSGTFTDVSEAAGVRRGYWGWGSCFADFNNDGYLDIFHVNGMAGGENPVFSEFHEDPSRLFLSHGNGTFTEQAVEMGIDDTGQGRGVTCFDADRDGQLDILIANNGSAPRYYHNEIQNDYHWLEVILSAPAPNTQGIGARITVMAERTGSQIREIRAGSNFSSQNPAEAHFGLRQDTVVDLTVTWPDGTTTSLQDVAADQVLVVEYP